MSNLWVYVLGERDGEDMKIGHHKGAYIHDRLVAVNRDQTTNSQYILLGAVRGSTKDEKALLAYFADHRREDKGTRREYFWPAPELVEYAAWLRGQWWTATRGDESKDDHAVVDPSHWLPAPERRQQRPPDSPDKLVQDYVTAEGALPGPWAWFPNPTISFQDFFTPPELIRAAARAMGGIDLDAASHWAANRVHQIPQYFDATRSAFTNDWYGNVWLNPPYGDNGPWFERALLFLGAGKMRQLCMLSPMWAFTTGIAADFMVAASGMVALSPTPKFWRNENRLRNGQDERLGSNHPHAIVYLGPYPERFFEGFAEYGVPMKLIKPKGFRELPISRKAAA